MELDIIKEGRFRYVEKGEGRVVILLHGLFGALSNFVDVIEHFSVRYKVIVPILPLYELPLRSTGLKGLVKYIYNFIEHKDFKDVFILGNSLGGHVALLYALKYPERVRALILTGSSGLYENTMGDTYPRRQDYEFVKEKTEFTFYDPKSATKELVDEVYEIINNRNKALRIIALSRSAMKNNLAEELHKINVPVLLIWGNNDTITPPYVAKEFNKLLNEFYTKRK